MIKVFFLVVFMAAQPNNTTPTYILQHPFKELQECIDFANANKDRIFTHAIVKYNFQIKPDKITCVHEDVLKNLLSGRPAFEGMSNGIPL